MLTIREFFSPSEMQQIGISLATSLTLATLGLLGWGLKRGLCKIAGWLKRAPSDLAQAIILGMEEAPCLAVGAPAVESGNLAVFYGDHVERWQDNRGQNATMVRNPAGRILVDGRPANPHLHARDVRLILRRAQELARELEAKRRELELEQLIEAAMCVPAQPAADEGPSAEEIEQARERLVSRLDEERQKQERERAFAAKLEQGVNCASPSSSNQWSRSLGSAEPVVIAETQAQPLPPCLGKQLRGGIGNKVR